MKAIHAHLRVQPVIEWGVKALRYLSSEDAICGKIVTYMGCEITAITLRLYCGDAVVVENVSENCCVNF